MNVLIDVLNINRSLTMSLRLVKQERGKKLLTKNEERNEKHCHRLWGFFLFGGWTLLEPTN